MIVSIHQPQYLPWVGYFDKIYKSDIFVFLDDVQFKKNEWQNRNKIKTKKGWQWITVPVLKRFPQRISEVLINNTVNWRRKHFTALVTNYSKARCFAEYKETFKNIYSKQWEYLAELNIYIIEVLVKILGIRTPLLRASSLKLKGKDTLRLVNICQRLGAETYLSGIGGRDYLDLEQFRRQNIRVVFQDFNHPVYSQRYESNLGFVPNMSIVDLLFNQGSNSLKILKGKTGT